MMRTHCALATSHRRKVPSSLPLSRLWPSGVKANPYTSAACPRSTARALPCSTSHSKIVVSRLLLASVHPSALQATRPLAVCPASVWRKRWLPASPTSHSLTEPSQLALARVRPSRAKASPITQLVCPSRTAMQGAFHEFCISHNRICPLKLPLASRCPSALQAIAETGSGCESVSRCVPLCRSQKWTIASLPPLVASRRPSGAKARLVMLLVCQPVQSRVPLSTSHSLTVVSQLPLASVCPSGLNARVGTPSVCACQTICKVWPAASHSRTSPRLLAAAQYCPLGLMATAEMASKVSVKAQPLSVAPDSVASCISTSCRYTPRSDRCDRSRPRRLPRSTRSSATRL